MVSAALLVLDILADIIRLNYYSYEFQNTLQIFVDRLRKKEWIAGW